MDYYDTELRQLKTCCLFDAVDPSPSNAESRHHVYMDPAGISLLSVVAAGLAASGFRITRVKPAFGAEAGCACFLNNFLEISLLLSVLKRHDRSVHCLLRTRTWRPFLSRIPFRKRPTTEECAAQFTVLLRAINDQLIDRVQATSPAWLTEREATRLPEFDEPPPSVNV